MILTIREQRVILDADLARLYGVTTKVFNQAIRRNRQRFPEDFAFQLTADELKYLRSQFVTSSGQTVDEGGNLSNASQFATRSHGGRRYRPWAFTEHGALMAANILRSKRAVEMSVFVVRAFVRLPEWRQPTPAILKRLVESTWPWSVTMPWARSGTSCNRIYSRPPTRRSG
ncbi:MAG: ORF6N domain-containing protein [Candidatus Manganitrophaceae bacterium]|nr:MAG: ORF6N domain-containing protein [Candidatus Manganitrophaceae bacterium]